MTHAVVLIKAERNALSTLGDRLADVEGVSEAYSVTGEWDFVAIVRVGEHDELADLVDVWEAANRDDLFSVTSLKHYPYVANSDFHKPKHLYSWKTLVRCDKSWPSVKQALRANTDIALTLFRNGSWAG